MTVEATERWTIPGPRGVIVGVLLALALVVFGVMVRYLPQAVDWHSVFLPAARALLSGNSPYTVSGYFNAPWALLPLLPLVALPEAVGRALLAIASLAALAFVAARLGAKPITLMFLLLSPPVLHGVLNGSLDWLAALGFVLPPVVGLFFIAVKPQVGIAVAIFWFVEAARRGGAREVVKVFAPITVALAASLAVFGWWPLRFQQEIGLWWNASLWPSSIPVGLVLIAAAIREREIRYAIAASPCLSPYVLLHSWVTPLLAICRSPLYTALAVLGMWIVVLLRAI